MKTRTLIESIKSRAFYLVLCLAMAAGFVGCSTEEVTEDDDITGLYIGGSEDTGETKITISKNSSGYTFNCTYEDWAAANSRLNVPIQNFGEIALKSKSPARIAGRCGVFAESDLIHKQQLGYPVEDLLYGLCQALVRNYLSNLALGKELLPIVTFQGGVATNSGMVKAFEEALNTKVVVPDNHQTMGAIGAALLAMENHQFNDKKTTFKGFSVGEMSFNSYTNQCSGCANNCEVITIVEGEVTSTDLKNKNDKIIARWGGTCGRWDIG